MGRRWSSWTKSSLWCSSSGSKRATEHSQTDPTGRKWVENRENSAGFVEQYSRSDQWSDNAHSSDVLFITHSSRVHLFPNSSHKSRLHPLSPSNTSRMHRTSRENELSPLSMDSSSPPHIARLSKTGIWAYCAGTKQPICANTQATPICLMKVVLPEQLGPRTSWCGVKEVRRRSLETTESEAASGSSIEKRRRCNASSAWMRSSIGKRRRECTVPELNLGRDQGSLDSDTIWAKLERMSRRDKASFPLNAMLMERLLCR